MSADGFHVHGAHEHELEHQAHGGDRLSGQVAIFTAILASVGAIISYQGGATQNESMLMKNEAVLKKTEASDQWNFFESKSNKAHLMSLAAELAPPAKQSYYQEQLKKYDADKKEIKLKAEALEAESEKANLESEHLMHPHHKLALAMTMIQIAIALASITALTRKRWLFGAAGISAAVGVALWLAVLL
jgi:hypothetical protein